MIIESFTEPSQGIYYLLGRRREKDVKIILENGVPCLKKLTPEERKYVKQYFKL
ncbi:hypothetical protein ACFSTE_15935 [Aquimarina hainanensis]|uniref:Uncharacterized protein n=2 Tax=Aquimarina hainanensis TaxID=1578017 RepID=A0ABW5NDN2_9FLAO